MENFSKKTKKKILIFNFLLSKIKDVLSAQRTLKLKEKNKFLTNFKKVVDKKNLSSKIKIAVGNEIAKLAKTPKKDFVNSKIKIKVRAQHIENRIAEDE